jgi:hypothetical protein
MSLEVVALPEPAMMDTVLEVEGAAADRVIWAAMAQEWLKLKPVCVAPVSS